MAEFRRLPTQKELQQILFMQGLQPQSTQQILQKNLAPQTINPIPENVFQKIAGGAKIAADYVNRAGTAADVAKLFPGYTGQSQVTIPTGFNFAPKQAPTGEIIPGGLQTNQVNVNQLLSSIKPADVLGLTGAQKAYTDVGMGRAPKPMDVLDVAGLGAVGLGVGKAATKASIAAGKYAAPELGRMAEQYAIQTGLLQPLTAYHGSPYTFDKFDIAKVGAGEGNQQYGYGMYFAEQPDVAKGYIAAGQSTKASDRPTEMIYRAIDATGGDLVKAKDWLNKRLETSPADFKDVYSKAISGFDSIANKGNLYKVDIPDEKVSTFIDWDTKLAGQKKAAKVVDALNKKYGFGYDKTYTGGDLYNALTADLLSVNRNLSPSQAQKLASEELNNFGIKGIKYFDQNSRGSKQGTRNYVVFDPTDVKILERK